MYYVNGKRGTKEYRKLSESPDGALLFYEDAIEKGYKEVTIMNKNCDQFEECDLRKLIDKKILVGD
jgi:hypothetical protein